MTDYEFFPEIDGDAMDDQFMRNLVHLRRQFGRPMPITSSYRSPEKNEAVGGVKDSAHTQGRAVDIAISGKAAYDLIRLVLTGKFGFTGVGLRQHGPHNKRMIHLDDMPDSPNQPRPILWTYA